MWEREGVRVRRAAYWTFQRCGLMGLEPTYPEVDMGVAHGVCNVVVWVDDDSTPSCYASDIFCPILLSCCMIISSLR